MCSFETLSYGTPIKFKILSDNIESNEVFAKVLCSNINNNNTISCITPHGSIFKVHHSNVKRLTESIDLDKIKLLEEDSLTTNSFTYNNLFDNFNTFGNI